MRVDLEADPRDLAAVRAASSLVPRVAIVLGSGLGEVAEAIRDPVDIPYSQLPGAPVAAGVVGHAGGLSLGYLGDAPVLAFRGRFHCYQGVSALDAAWTARIAAGLGADVLVVTNAAGALDTSMKAGEAVLIADHVNLLGDNPLRGWPGPAGGNPFVPMRDAYDPLLRELARQVADEAGTPLREGVYAAVLGPSYETPAEVAALRAMGADLVGMSTVPETIAARALGMRVLGLSLVTNVAAGPGLTHAEVLETGAGARDEMVSLLLGILSRL